MVTVSRRWLLRAATAVSAVAGWALLAPPQLGGGTTFMITTGTSMYPAIQAGDFALIRRAEHYRAGDVVAYRSTMLHTVVLHRIETVNAGSYIVKGDYNHWDDPGPVPAAAVVGRLWLRIPHGGLVLRSAAHPIPLTSLMALVVLLSGESVVRRRRRGRKAQSMTPRRGSRPAVAVVAPVVSLALLSVAYIVPARYSAVRMVSLPVSTQFGYAATVAAGPVYPDGQVRPPAPVFVRLVPAITITATRTLPEAVRVSGTAALVATLTSDAGWRRDLTIDEPRPFDDANVARAGVLDLAALTTLTKQVETLTSSGGGTYHLAVTLDVQYTATVSGRRLSRHDRPTVTFTLDPTRLSPASGGQRGDAGTSSLLQTENLTTSRVESVATSIPLGPQRVSLAMLRLIALVVAGASLLLAAVSGITCFRRRGSARGVNQRCGSRLVAVSALPEETRGVDAIEVSTVDALTKLADSRELPILYQASNDTYLVIDDHVAYRYRIRPPVAAEAPVPAHRGRPG